MGNKSGRALGWLVPFVEDEHAIFLKTIIPSRKATRNYLRKRKNESEDRTRIRRAGGWVSLSDKDDVIKRYQPYAKQTL